MAATKDRNTPTRSADNRQFKVGAGVHIFAGVMTALNSSGFLVPFTAATGLASAGRAETQIDNRNGADGDLECTTRAGCFEYANSTGADEITISDIGKDCYAVDDVTVALTDGSSARSKAGTIFDVSSSGVWVNFS